MVLLCISIDCISLVISILSFLIAIILPKTRTKLEITSVNLKKDDANSNKQDKLEITITNKKKRCGDAINVHVEVCLLRRENNTTKTRYLDVTLEDFALLPSQKKDTDYHIRKFYAQSKIDDKPLMDLLEDYPQVRVRVYSVHALSGFGKVQENYFRFIVNEFKKM
ncbi:MAG: hypothetical protein PUK04_01555 [Bacteroidales bacterium]|nr:hypothetical protein [Bacteroidales bacterium]